MGMEAKPTWVRRGSILLLSFVLLSEVVLPLTDPGDVAALNALKNAFIDPDGNLDSWKSSSDPCTSWTAIFCVEEDYPSSLAGSNYSYVTELRLLNLNLSGYLADEVGSFKALKYLDVMWNQLSGSIPASIGNLSNLLLLLLNGNQFSGSLPQEIGNLTNLNRIQIDQNNISGPVPDTFGKLQMVKHLHMNNNSLSGSIPPGLGKLQNVVHILLDNNKLTGDLPSELGDAPSLLIIQLDNNQFDSGTSIPSSYGRIRTLLKLSLRNCSLQGNIPDFSDATNLEVLDLSLNSLNGTIPNMTLPTNITAIDFSFNQLSGPVPDSVGSLPDLQYLVLRNNNLSGDIPASLGTELAFVNETSTIVLDFQNNSINNFAPGSNLVNLAGKGYTKVWLYGNPFCTGSNSAQSNPLCVPNTLSAIFEQGSSPNVQSSCSCSSPYAVVPSSTSNCRCAIPIIVLYRLKSPGFSIFDLYEVQFQVYLAEGLSLDTDQVQIKDYEYQAGPRILITLYLFPAGFQFNDSEVARIYNAYANWKIPDSTLFGPYELIAFEPPAQIVTSGESSLSAGAIAGIAFGSVVFTILLVGPGMLLLLRRRGWGNVRGKSRPRPGIQTSIKVAGVKAFGFDEMVRATDSFSDSRIVGQGGYGKVYYGVLEDGQKVAVKRAEESSLQGAHEFETEIQLLSRVHHRNLVGLAGYCNDEGEQMLVYEFMSNGTLRDHLKPSTKLALDFATRLRIALGSARGIHYLHTQADPPIFHRDIKASNILLDGKFTAKVADFGLSKLAPETDLEGTARGHVSTVVKGTPGYLDPEYFLTHKLTDKSDVYSFGVVLLELITGMQPISQGKNIVREVNIAYSAGMMMSIVDPRMGSYPSEVLDPLVRLALSCCKDDTDARPSMFEVVRDLEDIWKELPFSDTTSVSYEEGEFVDFNGANSRNMSSTSSVKMNIFTSSDAGSGTELMSETNINLIPR